MIFMSPISGVCSDFLYGRCQSPTHHEKPNGELALHICQPCYQIRQMLVHHTCSGSHPGHAAGERRVGAVGCPKQVGQTPQPSCHTTGCPPPQQQIVESVQSKCRHCSKDDDECTCVTYVHEPDARCPCSSCARFVRGYQISLDRLGEQKGLEVEDWIDLYSYYYDLHEEDEDDSCSSYSQSTHEEEDSSEWETYSIISQGSSQFSMNSLMSPQNYFSPYSGHFY